MKNYKNIYISALKFFKKIAKWFFIILGTIFFIALILSITDIPYNAYHWLGTSNSKITSTPDVIIILGGSGMPSPDGLIRTYFGFNAAKKYPNAKIIIALPYNENNSLHQLNLMSQELTMKGIDSTRIEYEPLGFNTRSQAKNIADLFKNKISNYKFAIVTSPEHMYRAIETFKKAGLKIVGGIPTFEIPPDPDKIKDKSKTTDVRVKNLSLRYNIWSYLNYELIVTREYFAIIYYKLKGWI